jgi:hypothetical protein
MLAPHLAQAGCSLRDTRVRWVGGGVVSLSILPDTHQGRSDRHANPPSLRLRMGLGVSWHIILPTLRTEVCLER